MQLEEMALRQCPSFRCFSDGKIAPYSLPTASVMVLVSQINSDICFFAKGGEKDADNKPRNCLITPLQR